MTEVVAPSRDDPVVRGGSEVVGGPLGRRAGTGRSWWTPLRVLLALTFLTCGVGLVQKDWCRDHGWGAPGNYTHGCYTDITPLYYGRGLADGEIPYVDQTDERTVEYPVLTGAAMWLTAQLVPDDEDPAARSLRYFDINALALAVCAGIAVAATALTSGRRPWDAALVTLAPGQKHVIQRKDIASLQSSATSIMPVGFEGLPPDDLKALLEYIAADGHAAGAK